MAHKITKLAEESPTAAKLLDAGLNAVRRATVSAGQTDIHGGTAGEAGTSAGITVAADLLIPHAIAATGRLLQSKLGSNAVIPAVALLSHTFGVPLETALYAAGITTAAEVGTDAPATLVKNVGKKIEQSTLTAFGKRLQNITGIAEKADNAVQAAEKELSLYSTETEAFQDAHQKFQDARAAQVRAHDDIRATLEGTYHKVSPNQPVTKPGLEKGLRAVTTTVQGATPTAVKQLEEQ
jgi:hypothetical protein